MHSNKLDSDLTTEDWKMAGSGGCGLKTTGPGGACATEPPFSDPELERTVEVCKSLYADTGAHARGVRIHRGPLTLRDSKKPPNRTGWVFENKANNPYLQFSAETPLVPKSKGPPKLWFPKQMEEPKKKKGTVGAKTSGPKYEYTEKDIKRSHKKLAERPRWDTEHQIMVSQSNHEMQKFVREYFDHPLRKESEGVPKVRELYAMNDRQSGWWDEPSPLGDPKHTYLDTVGPSNVGGCKEQQKVSYWRQALQKSSSAPVVKLSIKETAEKRSVLSLPERLAEMPAAQATQFWREWVDLSKNRLPEAPEERNRKRKGKPKRGGWPSPESPSDAAKTLPAMMVGSPKGGKEEWNSRWGVCASKDNDDLCGGHRQYFSSAQFLSGAEMGHPGAYLGLQSQKWRDVAKNVTLSPSGAAGRGPCGRTGLLV